MKPLTSYELSDLAKDSAISAEKLQQVIDYNLVMAVQASVKAFRKAFLKVQAALPIISHNGDIIYADGREGSYATNDLIQETIAPILQKHGFTLSFATTYPTTNWVKVTGTLDHKDGHSKDSTYEARIDLSGGKTDAQGRSSIISYGHRNITRDLLNLVTRGTDNDGATRLPDDDDQPKPEGYRDFENALRSAAMRGTSALLEVWQQGGDDVREAVHQQMWDDFKTVAVAVDNSVNR